MIFKLSGASKLDILIRMMSTFRMKKLITFTTMVDLIPCIYFFLAKFTIKYLGMVKKRRIAKKKGMPIPSMLDGLREQSTIIA